MFSNICQNTKCSLNNNTGYCKKIRKANEKESYECYCNLLSGRCVKKKKHNIDNNIYTGQETLKINDIILTSIKKKKSNLPGFGITYFNLIKECFPLPKSSGLSYGILKRPIDNIENKCIVYDPNYKYYEIKYIDNNLIIDLINYKILIRSSKYCKLLNI